MKNLLYLTKVLFINSIGFNSTRKKVANKAPSRLGTILLFAVLFIFVGVPMISTGVILGITFKELNLIGQGITSFLSIMSVMVLLFSIFGIISTFYLSKDIETLLALPFKPKEILVAKLLNSLTTAYLIEAMMLLPTLVGIGIGAHLNILFYINTILVMILLPIIPLSLFGIFLTPLMRYTALNRFKDKMQYIITIVIVLFAVAIEMIPASMGGDSPEELGNLIATQGNTLTYIMFFTIPASISLSSNNILVSIGSMIGYILLSIGAIYLFSVVGEKTYIKGVLGKPQIKKQKEKNTTIEFNNVKNTSVFKEMVKNEFRTVFRSPIYNMNLILPVFIMPIIFSIGFVAGFTGEGEDINELLSFFKEILNFKNGAVLVFTVAILSFFTCMSMIASSAISRDGKHAYINKYIPVKPMTIINAKVFWGIIFGIVPCVLITILGMVIGLMDIVDVILIMVPLFLYVVFTNYIGIIIDLKRPKLDWENETVAVKQNMNSMIFMLIDVVFTIAICALGAILLFINIPSFVASIILSLIFLVLCVIIYKLMDNKDIEIFKNIG